MVVGLFNDSRESLKVVQTFRLMIAFGDKAGFVWEMAIRDRGTLGF